MSYSCLFERQKLLLLELEGARTTQYEHLFYCGEFEALVIKNCFHLFLIVNI
jgi:hypothetical protein